MKKNLHIQITYTNSIQINYQLSLTTYLSDRLWENLFFWSICFLRTHSIAASAIINSQIEFCTKQCNTWRLYLEILLYQLNWILDITISFNSIYFCLFHIHFSMVFDHWFSWQLWHHKRKKCVTRTESLRAVGLKWLYLN